MELRDFNPIAGLAALWTREQLSSGKLAVPAQLASRPGADQRTPGIQFVHGSPVDEDEYVVTLRDAIEPLLTSAHPANIFRAHSSSGKFFHE